MAQGFVRKNNLAESVTASSDRSILDNLGGVNITQDVLLFDGNNAFKSVLINDSASGRADFFTFSDTTESNYTTVKANLIENKRAFSNGTKLSFNNGTDLYPYIVVDSNGVDEFRLVIESSATFPYDAGEYSAPWVGVNVANLTLTRDDSITAENLLNMSVPRLITSDVEEEDSEVGVSDGGASDGSDAPQEGIYDNYGTYDQVSYIAGSIGRLEAKKTRTILTDRSSFFEDRIRFKGTIRLTNNSSVPIYNNIDNAPGLFIYNPATGGEIRAFSGSDNPWSEQNIFFGAVYGPGLQTTSAKSQIANLVLSPDGGGTGITTRGYRPKLYKKSGAIGVDAVTHIDGNAVSSEQLPVSAYTHKVPVTINGEQFFMLVKEVT